MVQTPYFVLLIAVCSLSERIQRRYHYINTSMNWNEAQNYCRKNYTDLATVNNMNQMKELMKCVNNTNVWIGLMNTSDYKWKWSLGNSVNYQNWNLSHLDGRNNCTFMRNGTWLHQNCSEELNYICYNETSKSYIYMTSNKTWGEAQSSCRQNYTDLASVRNLTENQQIEKILNNTQISAWIGLFSDWWEWSDKSDSGFRNWISNEPNYGKKNPFCTQVSMTAKGQWNDVGCDNPSTFVCHDDTLILIKQNLSWIDALKYCREKHIDLVSVDSEEIQQWVTDVVKQASTADVWLGLRHSRTLDVWYWVSGEMICYENWAPGETALVNCENEVRSGAVQSGGDHRWISLPETEKRNFICTKYD